MKSMIVLVTLLVLSMATALDSCMTHDETHVTDEGADSTDTIDCPSFNVVAPLDLQAYLGTWYEYSRYEARFEKDARCVKVTYTDESTEEKAQIGVLNESIKEGRDTYSVTTGEAVFAEPDNPDLPAKLIVNFDVPMIPKYDFNNYNVVYTDYTSLSIVYACSSRGEFLYVLTRERIPDETLTELAYQKVRDSNLDATRLIKTNQENC